MKRCALLGLAALAVALASATSAAEPPIRVVGFSQIGTFKVRGGNPAKARAAFGRPASTKNTPNRDCLMGWAGIRISFYTLAHAKQCQPDTPFGIATITGIWVTDRGLRKGDTLARARKLYPRAEKPHFAGPERSRPDRQALAGGRRLRAGGEGRRRARRRARALRSPGRGIAQGCALRQNPAR